MALDLNLVKGIVIAIKANYFFVQVENAKNSLLVCTQRNKLNYSGSASIVGDNVLVECIDWKLSTGVIKDIEPRNSVVNRPLVANVSDIFVVISLESPSLDFKQASRFLLAAEQTGLKVSLILTKKDLIEIDLLNSIIEMFNSWCYYPQVISIKDKQGIDSLKKQLECSRLSILCGPSGVGKSSLLKYLLPQASITTGKLSKKLQRGRNTTRNVEIFNLSQSSFIADTPGFNRPELIIEPRKLASLFPEFKSLLKSNKCKFRNCLHVSEPGCAIDKSLERYSFYKTYLEEMITLHQKFQGD